jgi:hypothetical protein
MLTDVQKLDLSLKNEKLLERSVDPNYESESHKNKFLAKKVEKTTNNLGKANNTANEIIDRDKMTAKELEQQRRRMEHVNEELGEVESKLSLLQQIFGVLENKELANKLKLLFIVILLGIANLIILYIKLA